MGAAAEVEVLGVAVDGVDLRVRVQRFIVMDTLKHSITTLPAAIVLSHTIVSVSTTRGSSTTEEHQRVASSTAGISRERS